MDDLAQLGKEYGVVDRWTIFKRCYAGIDGGDELSLVCDMAGKVRIDFPCRISVAVDDFAFLQNRMLARRGSELQQGG